MLRYKLDFSCCANKDGFCANKDGFCANKDGFCRDSHSYMMFHTIVIVTSDLILFLFTRTKQHF